MNRYVLDPFPTDEELRTLWRSAWGSDGPASFRPVLDRSLGHAGAYAGSGLVGLVNLACDGGQHAFILDTCVHQDWRRRGVATQLVALAVAISRERGAIWLHVDFEPHLEPFHRQCGFAPTAAGLMRLT